MELTDLLNSLVRGVTLSAALYSCGGKEKEVVYPCRTDADCTSGTCVGGYCESPQQGDEDCGIDGGQICSCYEDICPGVLERLYEKKGEEYNINECNRHWTEDFVVGDLENHDDALFYFCQMQTGVCLNPRNQDVLQLERNHSILSCMESYGWVQCRENYECAVEQGESCNSNNRCSKP